MHRFLEGGQSLAELKKRRLEKLTAPRETKADARLKEVLKVDYTGQEYFEIPVTGDLTVTVS